MPSYLGQAINATMNGLQDGQDFANNVQAKQLQMKNLQNQYSYQEQNRQDNLANNDVQTKKIQTELENLKNNYQTMEDEAGKHLAYNGTDAYEASGDIRALQSAVKGKASGFFNHVLGVTDVARYDPNDPADTALLDDYRVKSGDSELNALKKPNNAMVGIRPDGSKGIITNDFIRASMGYNKDVTNMANYRLNALDAKDNAKANNTNANTNSLEYKNWMLQDRQGWEASSLSQFMKDNPDAKDTDVAFFKHSLGQKYNEAVAQASNQGGAVVTANSGIAKQDSINNTNLKVQDSRSDASKYNSDSHVEVARINGANKIQAKETTMFPMTTGLDNSGLTPSTLEAVTKGINYIPTKETVAELRNNPRAQELFSKQVKALSGKQAKSYQDLEDRTSSFEQLATNAPKAGKNSTIGMFDSLMQQYVGAPSGANYNDRDSTFNMAYNDIISGIRHSLYGSALTTGESHNFDKLAASTNKSDKAVVNSIKRLIKSEMSQMENVASAFSTPALYTAHVAEKTAVLRKLYQTLNTNSEGVHPSQVGKKVLLPPPPPLVQGNR